MRQSAGDELLLFNGRDGEWRARIAAVGKRAVALSAERRNGRRRSGRTSTWSSRW